MPVLIAVNRQEVPEIRLKTVVFQVQGEGSIRHLIKALEVAIRVVNLASEHHITLTLQTHHLQLQQSLHTTPLVVIGSEIIIMPRHRPRNHKPEPNSPLREQRLLIPQLVAFERVLDSRHLLPRRLQSSLPVEQDVLGLQLREVGDVLGRWSWGEGG